MRTADSTLDTDRLDLAGARVAAARGLVGTARVSVEAAREVPWVGAAAGGYRASLDAVLGSVRLLAGELDGLLAYLRRAARLTWSCVPGTAPLSYVAGTWRVVEAQPRPTSWSRGQVMVVGDPGGFVSVDPDNLTGAALLLRDAADALDGAHRPLDRALSQLGPAGGRLRLELGHARSVLGSLLAGPRAPRCCAAAVRDLEGRTRSAAGVLDGGESGAHSLWRVGSAFVGWLVAENPFVRQAFFAQATPVVAGVGLGGWQAVTLDARNAQGLDRIGGRLVSSNAVDGAIGGLTGWLRASKPGLQRPTTTPVRDVSADFGGALEALSGPVSVTPVAHPPQPSPARGMSGAIGLVALSDNLTGVDGSAPAPDGTVTVQRQTKADGSRTWLVAIPGTEALVGGPLPMDGITDVDLAGGVPDSMTRGVLDVMAAAGIPPDEPVVLAGHSQGGMVAMSVAAVVAATGGYTIGGVVTAGSPSIPKGLPKAVPVVRFEHMEDLVPHADDESTEVSDDVDVVRRSIGGVSTAHYLTEYQLTAELTDTALAEDPVASSNVAAVAALLADDGTTATTRQFQLAREVSGAYGPAGR